MGYFRDTGPHQAGEFSFWEVHHFYHGIIIILISFYIVMQMHWPTWISNMIFVIGIWNILDDLIQHIVQKEEIKRLGHYRSVSFWHWFPYEVLGWIRAITKKR